MSQLRALPEPYPVLSEGLALIGPPWLILRTLRARIAKPIPLGWLEKECLLVDPDWLKDIRYSSQADLDLGQALRDLDPGLDEWMLSHKSLSVLGIAIQLGCSELVASALVAEYLAGWPGREIWTTRETEMWENSDRIQKACWAKGPVAKFSRPKDAALSMKICPAQLTRFLNQEPEGQRLERATYMPPQQTQNRLARKAETNQTRKLNRATWCKDLEAAGSITEYAKLTGLSKTAATYRANQVGWQDDGKQAYQAQKPDIRGILASNPESVGRTLSWWAMTHFNCASTAERRYKNGDLREVPAIPQYQSLVIRRELHQAGLVPVRGADGRIIWSRPKELSQFAIEKLVAKG
jgi:hypothetical protein